MKTKNGVGMVSNSVFLQSADSVKGIDSEPCFARDYLNLYRPDR